jgi:hypothetical protein
MSAASIGRSLSQSSPASPKALAARSSAPAPAAARAPVMAASSAAEAGVLPVGAAAGGEAERLAALVGDHRVGLGPAAVDPEHQRHGRVPWNPAV